MTDHTAVMRQALDALKTAFDQTCSVGRPNDWKQIDAAIAALRDALAAPAEPVAVPADCDVRTLLLDVEPGDGSGREVYAKSVADVRVVLTTMAEHIEGLEARLAAAPAAPAAQALTGWTDINDSVPAKGTDCLVVSQEPWEKAPSVKLDRWDEIHEAPLSFSSATVYVGDGWVDDHCGVTHWMPLPAAPAGISQGGE